MSNSKKPASKGSVFQDIILIILMCIICVLVYLLDERFLYPIVMTFGVHFVLDIYTKYYKKKEESYLDFFNRNYFFFLFASFSASVIIYIFTHTLWLAFVFFIAFSKRLKGMWAKQDFKEDYDEEE